MTEENSRPVDSDFIISGFKDASSYSQESLRSILLATRASNALPAAGDDYDYYSTFQGFRTFLAQKGQSILSLMTAIVQNQGVREKFQERELEEKFDLLVDVNDIILENVSTNLDEATGLKKSEEELLVAVKPVSAINTSWNKKQFSTSATRNLKLLTAKNVVRPQLTFKDKVDNSNSPFVPIIKEKPNSIKPLAIIIEKQGDSEEFCHPYEVEIEKFNPSEDMLQHKEVLLPKPLEETPLLMITRVEELKNMCSELKKEKEFAVDLEHHSYRSFQGFTCLMQISTREKDYIVDVLELRSELHILNEVFTDPRIIKVLHGADMDILWLQHDFGIYVVNLFDTGQAARVLHFAHLSLAYLIKHYCKFDLDKQFQLADWRIRPLPEEMIKYARQDTHYLLYVYDCLKRDLIQSGNERKNLLLSTFDRSKIICLKKYQKPLFDEDRYLELYKKSKKLFNAKQLFCLKNLFSWRDKIARENDESLAYVLPNHMLLQIAEALPREQQGILACCNPIPPLVKQQLNELHSIVLRANDSSLRQLEMVELQQKAQSHKVNNQIDLSNLVQCPHDILHFEDKSSHSANESFTTLPLITQEHIHTSLQKKRPALSALFERPAKKLKLAANDDNTTKTADSIVKTLISPFQRYKVTEELQPSQKEKAHSTAANISTEGDVSDNQNDVSTNSNQTSCLEESPDHKKEKSSSKPPAAKYESTPLQIKTSKKKKKKKPLPDVSLIVPSPPQNRSEPEIVTVEDDSFQPYDYSQTDYGSFTSSKNSKGATEQEHKKNSQTYGRHYGKKRKHAKQATFGAESSSSGSWKNTSKWPKNK
ncbi:exosome component 10-like [Uloborus diversus]|uniref:exosome component 10-like n=1 Tax=Uloborus diversus TaxID=327109 RepID=UPI002409DC1C|nr:exosome component 10-like [Uloborus diversus]